MVAAALKAAELASADQYLNELKLMHVESGCDVEAWLVRIFQLCKKERQAPSKGLERSSWTESWPGRAWAELIADSVPLGAWAYAWRVAWLLREMELSKGLWRHVSWTSDRAGW